MDVLVIKCVLWGHHFLPRYFSKATPAFHYELLRKFFNYKNEYNAYPRGFAKDYWIETPTLTNDGYKKLKDIKVGDYVFGEDGKPTKVIKKTEIFYNRDCYSVKFSDGSEIIAGETHDWMAEDNLLRHRKDFVSENTKSVKRRKTLEMKKMTTKEISEDLYVTRKDGRQELKYSIPVCKPVEFERKELEIEPYFLGLWLGDGTSANAGITTPDEEIVEYIYEYAKRLNTNVYFYNQKDNLSNIYRINKLRERLKVLDLINNKHIPKKYLTSCIEQRLELLRGLMDSDGTISAGGHCSYSTRRKALAKDMMALLWSFGIKATCTTREAKIYGGCKGEYYHISFSTDINVFNLRRKSERINKKYDPRIKRRFIVSVEKVESVPTQCLGVDNESHLFLAGTELIPTHNTTCVQLGISYSCVNGLDEFIVLIEKTYTEASEVLEAVREEFKLNDEVTRVYGNLTKVNAKGHDQDNIRDSTGDFFINGVRLRARGFDSPIRGLKSRHSRPTRVILDDIESDEHIDNVEQRQKYLNNYIKGVIPAIDNDTGVIKMFGTILHDDSLLQTLINNNDGKVFAAWDKDHVLLWPSNWTVEKLEEKRMQMRIEGKGDAAFYQEYFNQPLDDENQIFRKTMFQYFNNRDIEELKKKPHRIYTLVDPAISKKATADFTAIVTVLVDALNRIYVLEITRKRMDPLETCKAIFAHYERWNPYYVSIEAISYQQALKYFIEEKKKEESSSVKTMVILEEKHTTDKIAKIRGLQPKYAILNVFHNSDDPNTTILEAELLRFPKAVHDDVSDGLSGILKIIVPVNKTIDRAVKKLNKNRRASVMY